ncbi:SUMF1/EgtB/PvdO family nonheme iron enzyme [uncultured Thiothrix sp.]|uniref:nSTAND1 domain-containing NTPase n=1 Tax=uncultured Thiothrix sp. TaxID=223185 RepID=UPI0026069738|nr:SUMF1/EgtB/PvdO family nonheme iron enzyme [uncultured Thiothrix sp.]HMT93184.1 SUMF1/EgtB/PvdO family nonheme iron enzyme [Thiolinea sp.]
MDNTAETTQYDFFISFAEDAKEWVYGVLVPKLGRTGKTFVLMGEITGNAWVDDLQANIEASEKILVVVTPQYCTSQRNHLLQLMAFTKGAEHREWPVVPLLLKSVDLELFLRFINGVNLTQYQSEEQLDALFAVPPRSQEEQQQLDGSPYPGMKTFEEEDASRFFGREEAIDRYVQALRNEHILVLTGASGCGKSSLARAGIIPRLKAKHQFLVKTVRPIDKDLDSWLEQAESALKHGDDSTKQFFSLKQPDQNFLLFIDQFEELFSTESDEPSNFILSIRAKQLLGLLVKLKKQVPNFYLLITLRAEFYPQLALCQAYLDFDNYLQRINALSREGLTNAITKPALKKYVYIDERLVERLVSEAGDDPGILPFVQETLRDLWEKRYENYIGLEAYESLGGSTGSGLKASIAAKADAAYKALISIDKEHCLEKESITKRIFLRLIQFGEGKPDTRRQQSISDLRSDQDTQGVFEETLRHLSSEKYRLLTVSRGDDDEDSKVDIVHEALIKAWPMLQEWISKYKRAELESRDLLNKVVEWDRNLSKKAGFLDKTQLDNALKLKDGLEKNGFSIENRVDEYIRASRCFRKKQLIKKATFPVLFGLIVLSYFSFKLISNYLMKQEVLALNPLIEVPAGIYTIGSNLKKDENYYPEWKVALNSFAMEQYEVSNYLYCLCTKVGVCNMVNYQIQDQVQDVCDAPKNEPVSNVNNAEAQVYCGWLNRRLPTEIEWEAAARTVKAYAYTSGYFLDYELTKQENDIKTSIFKTEKSKMGFYGLGRNVMEWTSSPYIRYCENNFEKLLTDKKINESSVLRGNTSRDKAINSFSHLLLNRSAALSNQKHVFIGFRCLNVDKERVNNLNEVRCDKNGYIKLDQR